MTWPINAEVVTPQGFHMTASLQFKKELHKIKIIDISEKVSKSAIWW